MLCRRNRNRVTGDIQPKLLALLGNVGEVLQDQLSRLVTAGSISHSRFHIFRQMKLSLEAGARYFSMQMISVKAIMQLQRFRQAHACRMGS